MKNYTSTNPNEHGTGEGDAGRLAESDRHQLLSVERRRVALAVLVGRTEPIELEDLAREVAQRENLTGGPQAEKRVAVTLHHNHLPRMDRLGVLEYDPEANRVESCSQPPLL